MSWNVTFPDQKIKGDPMQTQVGLKLPKQRASISTGRLCQIVCFLHLPAPSRFQLLQYLLALHPFLSLIRSGTLDFKLILNWTWRNISSKHVKKPTLNLDKCMSTILQYLTEEATKTIVTSCILSRLDYCKVNSLLIGSPHPDSIKEWNS